MANLPSDPQIRRITVIRPETVIRPVTVIRPYPNRREHSIRGGQQEDADLLLEEGRFSALPVLMPQGHALGALAAVRQINAQSQDPRCFVAYFSNLHCCMPMGALQHAGTVNHRMHGMHTSPAWALRPSWGQCCSAFTSGFYRGSRACSSAHIYQYQYHKGLHSTIGLPIGLPVLRPWLHGTS